jgi:serine/threonine-protein kinase
MVVGTPQYFAPEQARAKQLDGRADIYSLGVTMYRAATGRLPFEGDDWYEIARQHVEEPPPAPRSINPDISPAFEAAILHCLQKAPDDRPATGELLAQELVALLPATLETGAYRTRISGSEPTVVVRSDAHTAVPENGTEPQKGSTKPWIFGVAALVLFALGLNVFSRGRTEGATPPPITPESTTKALPKDSTPPAPVATPTPDTVARKDPVPSVRPGRLEVLTPDNSTILIDGKEFAVGSTATVDSIRPGMTVEVTARLDAPSGCTTASVTKRVSVRPGPRSTPVRLTPRSCGVVYLDATPKGSRWVLTSLTPVDSGAARRGTVPSEAVVLPVGDYVRVFNYPKCNQYADTVRIDGGDKRFPRVALFCVR